MNVYFLAIYIRFLKAKVQTLVNTATIQRIHSMTKYHEAKATTTKNKRYMYILFQKYPNRENRANVCPVCPAAKKKPTLSSTFFHNNEVNTCTDIITYRNTPTGKTRKTFAPFAGHPETPDFTFSSTWLDNNEIIHVSIYFQAHPAQALQLATTYQCCIQAQS